MASRSCTRCRRMYRGPAFSIYWGLIDGAVRESHREWLCPNDGQQWNQIGNRHLKSENVVYDEEWQLRLFCAMCDAPLEGHHPALFATIYAPHQDREDYFSELCKDCANHWHDWAIKNS